MPRLREARAVSRGTTKTSKHCPHAQGRPVLLVPRRTALTSRGWLSGLLTARDAHYPNPYPEPNPSQALAQSGQLSRLSLSQLAGQNSELGMAQRI